MRRKKFSPILARSAVIDGHEGFTVLASFD